MSLLNKFIDFGYKGFNCTVVQYSYHQPNFARIFLENIGTNGWWCGYVMIPTDNPYHGKDYDEVPIECHGGLTYGNEFHIEESANHKRFAFGFDFNHFDDGGGTEELVIQECKRIVDQLTSGVERHG